jgi:tripartite-type tricarboxylate transporter receptor subunit TctC
MRSIALGAVAFALIAATAVAQDYPTRSVTLLVPQASGAASDPLAHMLNEVRAAHIQPQ